MKVTHSSHSYVSLYFFLTLNLASTVTIRLQQSLLVDQLALHMICVELDAKTFRRILIFSPLSILSVFIDMVLINTDMMQTCTRVRYEAG